MCWVSRRWSWTTRTVPASLVSVRENLWWSCWRRWIRTLRSPALSRSAARECITSASQSMISTECSIGAGKREFSSSTKCRASAPRASGSRSCTLDRRAVCSSSCQITDPRGLPASERRIRVAAEIAHGRDVHVVDIPSLAGTLNHVEGWLPRNVPLLDLYAKLAVAADASRLSENAVGVVREEARKDHLTLLELRPVHRFPSGPGLGSKYGRHRLDVSFLRAFEELLHRQPRGCGAAYLPRRGLPRRACACGKKDHRGDQFKTHHTILHEIELRLPATRA